MFLMDQKGGTKSLDEGEASLSWYCIGTINTTVQRHFVSSHDSKLLQSSE